VTIKLVPAEQRHIFQEALRGKKDLRWGGNLKGNPDQCFGA